MKILAEPQPDEWTTELMPILLERPTADIARLSGVNRSTVNRWKAEEQRPRAAMIARLRSMLVLMS